MANLTDFDSAQLQTLLNIVVAKIVEEDQHKKEWMRRFFNDKIFGSQCYDEHQRPRRNVNYEHLCLWRTQILNAIGKVAAHEQINQN